MAGPGRRKFPQLLPISRLAERPGRECQRMCQAEPELKVSNPLPILELHRVMQGKETVMRIDLNAIHPEAADSAPALKTGLQAATSSAAGGANDAVRLSADHSTVQALAAKVAQLPEIRLEKVAALQQAIRGGSYGVTSEHTAGAIISEMEGRTAA
jgi:flagellar biosynthesis anti-sigma factor FlgM